MSLQRWNQLWSTLGATQADETLYREIIAGYSEPHRSYHTLRHLEECLKLLDKVLSLASHSAEVELALWFHDAIYDTQRQDNEERCADWAYTSAAAAALPIDVCDRVRKLVLITGNHGDPKTSDEALLIDIDLSILGASTPSYDEYEKAIREEYSWVPEPIFNSKRSSILKKFTQREKIYNTRYFVERYEQQARINLQRSIRE